jgi:hypothetical protein
VTATPAPRPRSRAVATWLAVVAGTLGAHRFYLHGARDAIAWLHLPPTLVGAYGWWRMREYGVDDARGSLLVLFLGAVVVAAMLQAIVYGLASDERWAARHGAASDPRRCRERQAQRQRNAAREDGAHDRWCGPQLRSEERYRARIARN